MFWKHNNLQSAVLWCTTYHPHIFTDDLTWTITIDSTPIMAYHHTFQLLGKVVYSGVSSMELRELEFPSVPI